MHRSVRTIDHHLVTLFVKLGVATRAEAVSAAHRLGAVASSPATPSPADARLRKAEHDPARLG